MKIKTKKTMTHGEFAKYLVDRFGIVNFELNLDGGEWFGVPGDIYNASINLKSAEYHELPQIKNIDDSTVSFVIREEITEDVEIDNLVVVDSDNDVLTFSNYTIKEIKNNNFKEYHAYIDGEFKLIWRDGKLVE